MRLDSNCISILVPIAQDSRAITGLRFIGQQNIPLQATEGAVSAQMGIVRVAKAHYRANWVGQKPFESCQKTIPDGNERRAGCVYVVDCCSRERSWWIGSV